MSFSKSFMSCLFLCVLNSAGAHADCAKMKTYRGSATVTITHAKPMKAKGTHWLVDFEVADSQDVLITKEEGKPTVTFLKKPFFKGRHQEVAIECSKDVCSTLARVDFKKRVVKAQVALTVACPDTFYGEGQPRGVLAQVERVTYVHPKGKTHVNLLRIDAR